MGVSTISGGGDASGVWFDGISTTAIGTETSNIGARGEETGEVTNGGAKINVVEVAHGIQWGYEHDVD